MKKTRIGASLLAAIVAASTLLTGCATKTGDDGNTPADGTNSNGGTTSGASAGENTPADNKPAYELTYADGTVLRMATGYNKANTGLFFDEETAGSGITLADGKTYNTGDLKPTWVEVENKLGIKFENKYQGNSAQKEFEY